MWATTSRVGCVLTERVAELGARLAEDGACHTPGLERAEDENITASVVGGIEKTALNRAYSPRGASIEFHKAVRVGGKDVNGVLARRENEPLSDHAVTLEQGDGRPVEVGVERVAREHGEPAERVRHFAACECVVRAGSAA